MTIFAGMEAIDTISQPNDNKNMAFILMDTFIKKNALAEDLSQIDQMLIDEEKFNTAFEQLEALRDSIEEFGLSKGVIKAVDPDGYLEANGIVPAYEELNDLPTKDEKSEIALEDIKDILKKTFKKIREFMIKLWDKFRKYMIRAFDLAENHEVMLKILKEKLLKQTDFDVKKAENKKFELSRKKNLEIVFDYYRSVIPKLIDSVDETIYKSIAEIKDVRNIDKNKLKKNHKELADKLKGEKENLLKYLGIKIADNVDYFSETMVLHNGIIDDISSKTIKDHGYSSINDVITIIDLALKSYSSLNNYKMKIKSLNSIYNEFNKLLDSMVTVLKYGEEKEDLKKTVINIKKNLMFVTGFIRTLFIINNGVIERAIYAGKAGIAVSK